MRNRQIGQKTSIAALTVLVALTWAGSFSVPFQFDDRPAIVENSTIRSLSDPGAIASFQPTRVITFVTFAVNYAIHGLEVRGYHLVNLAIHLLAVLALADLARRLPWRGSIPPGIAACATAAIFAVHPLQTQAVTYIQQRSACMAGALTLTALALYARSRPLGAAAVAAIAMLTKENAFAIPFAVVALEATWRGRPEGGWLVWARRHAPLVSTVAIVPVVSLVFGNSQVRHLRELSEATPWTYFATQWSVLVRYLSLTFLPVGQALDHGVRAGSPGASEWSSLVVLAAACVLAWRARARAPVVSFGIALFFVAHAVESSFVPLADAMFEQRMYLPLAGVALAVVGGVSALRVPLKAFLVAAAVALVSLALLTHARNRVWQDPVVLWQEVTEHAPSYARGWNGYGNELARADRHAEALEAFGRAVALAPEHSGYRYQRLLAALDAGRADVAHEQLAEIARLDPGSVIEAYAAGIFHERTGGLDLSVEAFERALQRSAAHAGSIPRVSIFEKLVAGCVAQRRFDRALGHLRQWMIEDPNDPRLTELASSLERANDER